MKIKYCFAACLFLLLFMRAEAINAVEVELQGVILDWQEARINNVSIIIEAKNFRRSLVSDETGEFRIALPEGTYKVSVSHPVFKTYRIKKLKVSEAKNPVLRIHMNVKTPTAGGGKCPKGHLCL